MVEYKAFIVKMHFDEKKAKYACENLRAVMWPIINFGYAMFHAYVKGGSDFHEVCSMLRCF
jgi:hypothetical protein